MKNTSVSIGNRTRDLPTCSAVPQPAALPRAQFINTKHLSKKRIRFLLNTEVLIFIYDAFVWQILKKRIRRHVIKTNDDAFISICNFGVLKGHF